MTQPSLDPVSVVIALVGLLFSPDIAAIAGPYAIIMGGAFGGALWSASGRPASSSWWLSFFHIAGMTLLGVMAAVPASEWIAAYFKNIPSRWLFGLVAFGCAARGTDWLRLLFDAITNAFKALSRLRRSDLRRILLRLLPEDDDPKAKDETK